MCAHVHGEHAARVQISRLGIQVSLTIYVCLSGLWWGGLLYLSFLFFSFLKASVPCTCISMHVYTCCCYVGALAVEDGVL